MMGTRTLPGRYRATGDCGEMHELRQGDYDLPMTVTRRVSVERNRLRFAAAHFATFLGGCEPLHGHNYDLTVELEGDLTDDSWVWDFGELKRATKAIADELDHKFILQRESRLLEILETESSWKVRFGDRGYVFPKSDVAVLSIDNSTAERLAEWFAGRLLNYLDGQGAAGVRKLTVGVEEMPGQAGWYTVDR
jgi:6-pyruvoyltetrahydropterin/6-carboxytetrahydropterin synthase